MVVEFVSSVYGQRIKRRWVDCLLKFGRLHLSQRLHLQFEHRGSPKILLLVKEHRQKQKQ